MAVALAMTKWPMLANQGFWHIAYEVAHGLVDDPWLAFPVDRRCRALVGRSAAC
jgi:hypothetical protein